MLIVAEISDLLPVYAICGNQFPCRSSIPFYRRVIKTSTISKLIAELNQRTWPHMTGTFYVNLSYNNCIC